jgi:hypothetical protein
LKYIGLAGFVVGRMSMKNEAANIWLLNTKMDVEVTFKLMF